MQADHEEWKRRRQEQWGKRQEAAMILAGEDGRDCSVLELCGKCRERLEKLLEEIKEFRE